MTPEEYYGDAYPLLKKGESFLKELIEAYQNTCEQYELQSILYMKTRIKAPESMMEKLRKHGLREDAYTALQNTHDAIGIRIICSFVEDVYHIAEWLEKRNDIQIMEKKDYISYPKPNGYRSLHLIVRFLTKELKDITAEIQLRTIAIDFWATLEHQIKYKKHVQYEETIQRELKRCADEIASVDLSMQTIREILQSGAWERA